MKYDVTCGDCRHMGVCHPFPLRKICDAFELHTIGNRADHDLFIKRKEIYHGEIQSRHDEKD